jgi:hypothetical protein
VAPVASAILPHPPPPPAPPAPPPDDAAAPEPPPDPAGEALRAVRLPGPELSILLPFDKQVSAAAFGRGGQGHAVFDDSRAIDLAALKTDPVFASARIQLTPSATQLTMALPPGAHLALRRHAEGWAVTIATGTPDLPAAQARLKDGVVTIAMPQAADSLVLVDPDTGGKLLVGTVRDHGGALDVPHLSPEFRLLPSWDGVVVAAIGDRLALTPTKTGFALRNAAGPKLEAVITDAAQTALESAGALTRRFAIAPLPIAALRQRLGADVQAAAAAPKQGRFVPRLLAAQDMLALGLDREAASLLDAAMQDDPAQASRPDAVALLAMARFLAGIAPPEGAPTLPDALANPALGASDEVALWRALAPAQADPPAARAATVAADWRLLLAYPPPLRRRLMPLAAAILIDGHQIPAAQDVLAASDDPGVAPARARLLQAQGKLADAAILLDRVAAGTDRKRAAQAALDAIELRLQTKQLTAAQAAHAILGQLYAWRDPGFETASRARMAALLVQAGAFREALAQLRETERLFPDTHAAVHAAEQRAVQALVQAGSAAKLSPLDLVALVDENADLLGEHDTAASLTPVLVDKLMALDLPERAGKLVAKLMDSTEDAQPKAALGARLAALRLDQGDPQGALAALDRSDAANLPLAIDDTRVVLRAHALIDSGHDADAQRLLAPHGSDDALELLAQLQEKSKDWHGAEASLLLLTQHRVPAAGALSDAQQDLVLRLASAASQAADMSVLRQLQGVAAPRLSPGPRAALFQALAAQPVQGVADLPRSAREAEAARQLPAALASYEAH